MTICCVIPARFNSTRFPGKLLERVSGKTVLQRTFENASSCPKVDHLFVATDDERIASHISSLGGNVIWTSPHCRDGTERIKEALEKEKRLQESSLILNVQGDHPCTHPNTMSAVIEMLERDPTAPMATAVSSLTDFEDYYSPHVVKCVFDSEHNALYFSRSPIPYIKPGSPLHAYVHIGIYGYRTFFLKKMLSQNPTFLQKSEDLEQLKVLESGHRIKIAVVDESPLGVDTPQDLQKLEKFLCR